MGTLCCPGPGYGDGRVNARNVRLEARPIADVIEPMRHLLTRERLDAAFAELRARGPGVLLELRPHLFGPRLEFHLAAYHTFTAMPESGARVMLPWLRERRPERVTNAITMLALLRAREAVVPLIGLRHHPDPEVRLQLPGAFFDIGDRRAVIALIDMAENDADPTIRRQSLKALAELGSVAAESVPYLESKAQLPDGGAHCKTLGGIGKPALPALRRLFKVANKLPESSRIDLLHGVCGKVSDGSDELDGLMPTLADCTGDPDPKIVDTALGALAGFGGKAKKFVPTVERVLRSGREDLRWMAARTLLLISPGNRGAIDELTRLVRDSRDGDTRYHAIIWLSDEGPAAAHAAPPLRRAAADDSDQRVRRAAADALDAIRPPEGK